MTEEGFDDGIRLGMAEEGLDDGRGFGMAYEESGIM